MTLLTCVKIRWHCLEEDVPPPSPKHPELFRLLDLWRQLDDFIAEIFLEQIWLSLLRPWRIFYEARCQSSESNSHLSLKFYLLKPTYLVSLILCDLQLVLCRLQSNSEDSHQTRHTLKLVNMEAEFVSINDVSITLHLLNKVTDNRGVGVKITFYLRLVLFKQIHFLLHSNNKLVSLLVQVFLNDWLCFLDKSFF